MTLLQALHHHTFGPIIRPPLPESDWHVFNFTANNEALKAVDLKDRTSFEAYIWDTLERHQARGGIGGYLEPRVLYQRSAHFSGEEEARSLHLGVDLWLPEYTPLYAPLHGTVHSYANNTGFGDYGPTLILQHELHGHTFYTLYGHLSKKEMDLWQVGKGFAEGELIGSLGDYTENGDWPPHLHFQVITDMLGKEGDFPGVARPSEKDDWAQRCPNPNLILGIDKLDEG